MDDAYPLAYKVDYPDRSLNRLTTFFRPFVALPIVLVLWTLGGLLVPATGLMIVFRRKYPRWWFEWNRELQRFSSRVGVYLALMDDRYPSTDEEQSVHLQVEHPDAERDLNRWLPLVKWLLALPHYIVLVFLSIGALLAVLGAWFAILFTGRYPRALFTYLEGVGRWHNRVLAYTALLVTDRYPPFRLGE